MQRFKHFVLVVKQSKNIPYLDTGWSLFSSHGYRGDTVLGENRVQIVGLPLRNTNTLQPMGVSFMQPLKTYHAQEIESWSKNHPNRVVTGYPITGLVGKAYLKSATAAITAKGF